MTHPLQTKKEKNVRSLPSFITDPLSSLVPSLRCAVVIKAKSDALSKMQFPNCSATFYCGARFPSVHVPTYCVLQEDPADNRVTSASFAVRGESPLQGNLRGRRAEKERRHWK